VGINVTTAPTASTSTHGDFAQAMAIRPVTINPLTEDRWDAFVDGHHLALPFHHSSWLRALSDGFGYDAHGFALVDSEDSIVAAWPAMLVRSRITGTRLIGLPFSHIDRPLQTLPALAETLIVHAHSFARAQGASRVEVRGWIQSEEPPALLHKGTAYWEHCLDLQGGIEAVLARMDKDVRYSSRRAQRQGVTVRISESLADLETFFTLYTRLRRNQLRPVQPWKFIEAIGREIIAPGRGFIVVTEYEGRPLNVFITLLHGKTALGTHSGANPASRELRAGYLAMLESISEACRRGMNVFNLGRTGIGDAGQLSFKKSFGATGDLFSHLSTEPSVPSADQVSGPKRMVMRALSRLPDRPYATLSGLVYPHLA
jgi:CelD/BcsL family acetyltransferase involved in cellulose biosynthesis